MGQHERLRKRNFHQVIGLLVLAVVAVAGWYAYGMYLDRMNTIDVWFDNAGKKTKTYRLRTAVNDQERQRGLMYVRAEELEPNRGMLFVYPEERTENFWMKDTFAPLDMVFIDKSETVVGIVHDAAPFTLDRRGVDKPAKYVVELLAGSAKRDGIVEGSRMIVENEPIPLGK